VKDSNKESGWIEFLPFILLALVLAAILFVHIRLLGVPMERDEGEYAYFARLLLKGIPPYAAAYTMKLPGVSFMYALFMVSFGQTTAAIHTGLLAPICLIYLLTNRLLGRGCSSHGIPEKINPVTFETDLP
jgi:hypothetical protein